jgi:hypothetical protein
MNGKLFPFRTKHKLYDSIIIPGYWQCDLDWRRRGRPLTRHRCRRLIATTLSFGGSTKVLIKPFFYTIPMLALLITPMFAAAGYSLIYLLFGGGLGGAFLIFSVAKMVGK